MDEKETNDTKEQKDTLTVDEAKGNSIPPSTSFKSSTVKVKLSKKHIHAGVEYQPDTVIEVDKASADFIELAKSGKIV